MTQEKQTTLKERVGKFYARWFRPTIREIRTFRAKKSAAALLPYGRPIEKVYLAVICIAFIVLMFKNGAVVSEDKVLMLSVAAGGLFLLRAFRGKVYFPKTYTILLAAFLLFSLITTIFSIAVYASLMRYIELIDAGVISLLGYDIVYGKYSRRWIMNALSAAATIFLLYGIFVQYMGDKTSLQFPLGLPAYTGVIAVAFFPYVLYTSMRTRRAKKLLFSVSTLVFMLAIVFTFARPIYVTAILEVLVFLAMNLFTGRKQLRKPDQYIPYIILVIIAAVAVILLHFPTSGTVPYTTSSFTDRNIPVSLHVEALKQGLRSVSENPVIGVGLNNFRIESLYHMSGAWEQLYYMYNDILEMFVSEGIIGGLLFMALLGYVISLACTKVSFKKLFIKYLPEGTELFMGILAILLLSLWYPVLHVPVILFILFLFIGMFLKTMNVDNKGRYYFGALALGLVTGLSSLIIIASAYSYAINYMFINIQNTLSVSNPSASTISTAKTNLERLVKLNPIDSEYSSILSQIDVSQSASADALTTDMNVQKYNKKDPYLIYSTALDYYFKGDISKSLEISNQLLAKAPYIDPSFYLIRIQEDPTNKSGNSSKVTADLKDIAKKFAPSSYYYLYQPIFYNLGQTSSLSKIYLELAIVTKDNSYYALAQKIDPQDFAFANQQSTLHK